VLVTALLAGPPALAGASPRPVGLFDGHADVGAPALPGSASYDAETQSYVVAGAGANMWSDRDELHLVWKRLRGDFILRARVQFVGEGVDPHRKMGWIVRTGLEPDAAYVDVAVHGDGRTALQFRRAAAAETEEVRSPVERPDVIQLSRRGTTYAMAVARFGEVFSAPEEIDLELGDEVFVGLFVCSHDAAVTERARFRNVRIVVPAGEELVPYRDYLASNLEILDVATGHRTIVHRTEDSLQAPNWTPDGRQLIYNRNGLLYRFDLAGRTATVLDTGFADNNNNDHVLSFDGSMLGISHHDPATDHRSIVYTLPATGGRPQRVTEKGPSYLHGWSPDGRFLIYTGERDGDYDIYRIPAAGGEETRLTHTAGLDDGSEYSPDGRSIYFNSVRSGRMEIWRMGPDGGQPKQLTDDELNNWFPHVSPDGESVVFLSYSADVEPSDHPFYKEVYLRKMPASGGPVRVVAYLYGGQGTINVPSWAPDGRRLAFVSNTGGY
jgi:TolB protein